jgi:hypothetical protein
MKMEEKAAKMSALVGLWREGGGSKKAFCASHGINVHTFNYWIAKLDSEQEGSNTPIGFVPLCAPESGLSICFPSGAMLRVGSQLSGNSRFKFLNLLRGV